MERFEEQMEKEYLIQKDTIHLILRIFTPEVILRKMFIAGAIYEIERKDK